MNKKVSVFLDNDILKKLHDKRAKLILKSQKNISLSNIVNETLRLYFK